MPTQKSAPFGSWKSPITPQLILEKAMAIMEFAIDGQDIYWIEMRPSEGGRCVIVQQKPDGSTQDLTPPPFNARTRVHEYGGGAMLVHGGVVWFSNFADQRLYRLDTARDGGVPKPVNTEGPLRFADGVVDTHRNRLVYVCEDHSESDQEARNMLVAIPLQEEPVRKEDIQVLASGWDFYAAPRISPDGSQIAWKCWNHPNMPWDDTALYTAQFQPDGMPGEPVLVAGGVGESVQQPVWSPDNQLFFISDRTNWWNIYRWEQGNIQPVLPHEAEFGGPEWVFGLSTYAFETPETILTFYLENGSTRLVRIHLKTGQVVSIPLGWEVLGRIKFGQPGILTLLGSARHAPFLALVNPQNGQVEPLRQTSAARIAPAYISNPEAIAFPTSGGQTAYAFFYPPQNQDYAGPKGQKPPLIVMSHGGPTSAASSILSLSYQFWTSRGFAIVDVNYGGSTGFGRAYRQRLNGSWGIVDVEDCVNAARFLVGRGDVDPNRLAIRGGSAGGYTTLAALAFHDVFHAGASHFGVSDLEGLAKDTHKFESRYLDNLVGAYPAEIERYHQRSPLYAVDQLSCPVIFFQGLEDKVVPPQQAELMVNALKQKGIPVAYIAYEGEQHGFRKAENIKRTLEAELYFYSRVFGFVIDGQIEPVEIMNL